MSSNFFIVFSLSRCGSTALYRALNAHSDINCCYEPPFSHANWSEEDVIKILNNLRNSYSGIKHVWDPSGFPFVDSHLSVLEDLDEKFDKVLELNKKILSNNNQNVVFLRRRDQTGRLLSDLLGQQTGFWTPAHPKFPKAQIGTVLAEAKAFRQEMSATSLKAINPRIIEWYLDHVPVMEKEFVSCISSNNFMSLYYEDIFDPELNQRERLDKYKDILCFLGYSIDEQRFGIQEVSAIFDPRAKLNNQSTIDLIPNIEAIMRRFGVS